jgi:hypothetical protein
VYRYRFFSNTCIYIHTHIYIHIHTHMHIHIQTAATWGIRLVKTSVGAMAAGSLIRFLRDSKVAFERPLIPVLIASWMRVYTGAVMVWQLGKEEDDDMFVDDDGMCVCVCVYVHENCLFSCIYAII